MCLYIICVVCVCVCGAFMSLCVPHYCWSPKRWEEDTDSLNLLSLIIAFQHMKVGSSVWLSARAARCLNYWAISQAQVLGTFQIWLLYSNIFIQLIRPKVETMNSSRRCWHKTGPQLPLFFRISSTLSQALSSL